MARLWHTAILVKWNPIFEYIPIESQIEKFQDDYYDAIAKCHVEVHIAKLNGRLCGTKRPHSVSEQPNFYQSLQSNPYNDSSHPSGGE
ncbi:hypothetical protein [Clostridium sp. MCC328]|uniref:hypothetical protein n=1 Tax=Clostridium sp. MCC328 TaxID=2592642 RepID=UPI00207A6E2F|nr:hypothetical protein [Clostridium sp. MCC328]